MYDALTTRYTFACPARGETSVRLSAFRRGRPAARRRPPGRVPRPLRLRLRRGTPRPRLTRPTRLGAARPRRARDVPEPDDSPTRAARLGVRRPDDPPRSRPESGPGASSATPRSDRGPCSRPSSASSPQAHPTASIGLAVLCPACVRISINLVTHEHVDLPFHNDAEIGVVQHVFTSDTTQTLDEFRARLYSSDFDARRLQLE